MQPMSNLQALKLALWPNEPSVLYSKIENYNALNHINPVERITPIGPAGRLCDAHKNFYANLLGAGLMILAAKVGFIASPIIIGVYLTIVGVKIAWHAALINHSVRILREEFDDNYNPIVDKAYPVRA